MTQRLADLVGRAMDRFQPKYLLVAGAGLLVLALVGTIFLHFLPLKPSSGGVPVKHVIGSPPTTSSDIHLIQMFDYDISVSQITPQLTRPLDLVWGADANPAKLRTWHRAKPTIVLSSYLSFERDSQGHDLAYWKRTHPDWILYQCDQRTPAYLYHQANVPLDFSNPAVQQWQLATTIARAEQMGYDALAVDDINLHNVGAACGHYQGKHWVPLYTGASTDSRWSASVLLWLKTMQQQLHTLRHPLALITALNLAGISADTSTLEKLLASVDAVVMADGFNNVAAGQDWVKYIYFMQYVQQQQKAIYIVNQFTPPPDQFVVANQQIQWALASYLMGEEGRAGLFIGKQEQFGDYLFYPPYAATIGQPIGQMYAVPVGKGRAVYLRDFSQGESIVNPDPAHSYTIVLPAGRTYYDLQGYAVSNTVTLSPLSGIVLLTRVQASGSATGPVSIVPLPTPTVMPTHVLSTPTPPVTLAPPTPTLAPGLTAQDTFHRPDQSSWGTASGGSPWQLSSNANMSFSIVHHTGQVTASSSDEGFALLGTSNQSMEVVARITYTALPGGQSYAGVVLNWSDSNDWYALVLTGNTIDMIKDVQGVRIDLVRKLFMLHAGSSYTLRFLVMGATLYGKAWAGADEPDGWQAVVSDNSLGAGNAGILVHGQAGTTIQVTSFKASAI